MEKEKTEDILGNSNKEFKQKLDQTFKDTFWQILSFLEIAFPHKPGDGSENEKKFNTLRSKVLRSGNDAVRGLDQLFESYVVFQLYEYKRKVNNNTESLIFDFKSKYQFIKGKENSNDRSNSN